MLSIPNRLGELVADNRIIPFLGSGFSIPSGLPTWTNLVDGLIRNCASDVQQSLLNKLSSELAEADLTDILNSLSTTEFAAKEYLIEQINSIRYEPSEYHRLLLDLNSDTIITTNWDLLIEQSLTANHVAYRVIHRDVDVSQYDPDRAVQVIKPHGTILDADSLVYRQSQYRRFWEERPLLLNLVCTLMATKSFLFLGYGFGDPNMFALLDILHERLGNLRREHYALTFGQGQISVAFQRYGIRIIDGIDPESPRKNYVNITKQFLAKLTGSSRLVSLSNLERSRLINSELLRLINRMPPKPILRMRGALGWLSNPIPVQGDPIYGTDAQDQEERLMTELICQYLESNSSALVRCILHLEIEPLLWAGYQPQHLVRRFSAVAEMLLKYPMQIQIAHDSTPSYLNLMLFDEQAYLFGFKRSHTLGIQRALLRRTRSVVRSEVQQFDDHFCEIRDNNFRAAGDLGADAKDPAWSNAYVLRLINEQIEDLESRMTIVAATNRQPDLGKEALLHVKAVEFALRKHREYGQTREDGVTPYGIHILRVIERLRQVGLIDDFEILTAAALHDVVEDCEVKLDDIRSAYGERVAIVVGEVTRGADQIRSEYIAQLLGASREGKTVKLADRLDNVIDLKNFKKAIFGGRPASEYLEEAKNVLAACGDANQRLADALDRAIKETLAVFEAAQSIEERNHPR